LDAKIRQTEKEVRALENTLRLMESRNEQYRDAVYRSESDSKDIDRKDALEEVRSE
jgi:hypothetical protein